MAKITKTKYKPKLVAILGPGAIGGFLASIFWKNNINVLCLGKQKHISQINKKGINFRSKLFGNFIVRPKANTRLTQKPDILFITTKSTELNQALKKINPKLTKFSVVIPLLNGFNHIKILKKYFGSNVILGTISAEVYTSDNKVIHTTSFAKIDLASDNKKLNNKLTEIISFLNSVGFDTKQTKSETQLVWNKLVRLNLLASLTALTNKPIGYLRKDKFWQGQIKECLNEGINIARKDGAKINYHQQLEIINKLNPHQLSSMQRDISQGKQSEIDSITGAVLRLAKKYNIQVPTIESIYKKLKEKIKPI